MKSVKAGFFSSLLVGASPGFARDHDGMRIWLRVPTFTSGLEALVA